MQASDYPTWRQFFRDASIPDEYASSYAAIFTDNRMRLDMLADLDRALLNEMGITAIGDCLSILKHAKATYPKIKTSKKEQDAPATLATTNNVLSQSIESISSNESPKPPRLAKRIVDRLISDTDYKSTGSTVTPNHNYTNSTLSADLLTRLNFNPSTVTTATAASSLSPVKQQQPVVLFNKESLEPSKMVVSSTTGDSDSSSQSPSKIISLKRKLNDHHDVKSGSLKQADSVLVVESSSSRPSTKPSANNSMFSGISITTDSNSKTVKLSSSSRADQTTADNETKKNHSVFKRIKSGSNITNDKSSPANTHHSTTISSTVTKVIGSKVISLKNSTSGGGVGSSSRHNKSQLDQQLANNNNKRVKSIKDRLSFNK